MNAPRTITVFRCVPLRGAELTRSSCGARWDSLNTGKAAKRAAGSGPLVMGRECVGCPIGKAHSDGDRPEAWPDGDRIEFVDKSIAGAVAAPPAKMPRPDRQHGLRGALEPRPPEPPVATPSPRHEAPSATDVPGSEKSAPAPAPAIPTGGNPSEVPTLPEPVVLPPIVIKPRSSLPERGRAAEQRPPVSDGTGGEAHVEAPQGRVVTVDGVSRTIIEWASLRGLTTNAIYERLRRNWPLELAVTAPRGTIYEHATRPTRVVSSPHGVRVEPTPVPPRLRSVEVTWEGRTQTVAQWVDEVGITIQTVRYRMHQGEPLEEACTRPSRPASTTTVDDHRPDVASPADVASPPPSSLLGVLAKSAAASPSSAPAAELLRAAGYVVVAVTRAPHGLVIVVRETS